MSYSVVTLIVFVGTFACLCAFPSDGLEKRYQASNFHLGFGKRSVPMDSDYAKRSAYSQFHMGLGKRSDSAEDESMETGDVVVDVVPIDESMTKRFDSSSQFHMGFGKRSSESANDMFKRFSGSQFHMGLGKRSSPIVLDLDSPMKKNFHMGFGKRSSNLGLPLADI